MLKEAKGIELLHGSWMTAGFEVAGLAGIILTGWITDRFFAGRVSRMCVLCMAMSGVAVACLWKAPPQSVPLKHIVSHGGRFFVYAPQALVAGCREPWHEARGGHGRGSHEHLRLLRARPVGLGLGYLVNSAVGARALSVWSSRPASGRCSSRDLARQGAWIRRVATN